MPIKQQLQVQAGTESGDWASSPATATVKRMGFRDFTLKPTVKGTLHKDLRRSMAPGHIATLDELGAMGSFDSLCLYDDIPYDLEGIFGVATPSGSGPYTRVYNAPVGIIPTPRAMSYYYGETGSTNVYRATGCIPTSLSIAGESGGTLSSKGDLLAHDIAAGASMASLSDRVVTPVQGGHVRVFLDAWDGTIGATELPAMFYSFELKVDTGRATDLYLGALTPGDWHEGEYKVNLNLSARFHTTTKALLDATLDGATNGLFQKQVRLLASIGSGGNQKSLQMDFAGSMLQAPELFKDRNGLLALDFAFDGTYNPTLGNYLIVTSTNGIAALA